MKLMWGLFITGWLMVTASGESVVVYDSKGFEGFDLGPVHGQIGGFYIDSGAKESGVFDVVAGDKESAVTIIDSGTSRGKVLSFNKGKGGWNTAFLDIGWRGDESNPMLKNKTKYIHLTFDFYDNGVSGAITTYRGRERASQQAKVWLQKDAKLECRKNNMTADSAIHDVKPKYELKVWHTFTLTTMWEDTYPVISAYVNGEKLDLPEKDIVWYATWNGIPGWFDAVKFNYLVNSGRPLLIDNLVITYSDLENL